MLFRVDGHPPSRGWRSGRRTKSPGSPGKFALFVVISVIPGALNAVPCLGPPPWSARPLTAQTNPREQTSATSRRFLAIQEDTQKSSWVLVDATVFAALAGLTEAVWMRLVGGFLYHSLGGAARIESVKLTSSANTSLLKVALTSTASPGWRGAVSRNVALSEFRKGNVTGLLLSPSTGRPSTHERGGISAESDNAQEPAHSRTGSGVGSIADYGQELPRAVADRALGKGHSSRPGGPEA